MIVGSSSRSVRQLVSPTHSQEQKEMNVSMLACAPLHFSTFIQFRTLCLWNGAAHSELSIPSLIDCSKAVHRKCAYRPAHVDSPSSRISSQ